MEISTDIYCGDSKEELKRIPDNFVDLIVVSSNEKFGPGLGGGKHFS